MTRATRIDVLRSLGATPAEAEELLRYNDNAFTLPDLTTLSLPLADEPFVAAWAAYVDEARRRGAVPALRHRLRQFCFPVASGISQAPEYIAATCRGRVPTGTPGLAFEAPERVRLFLHPTPAGRIPVLLLEHRADFVMAVRALTRRNEPVAVPNAQGAVMVAGYNNWDRVDLLRTLFERGDLEAERAWTWGDVFRAIRERKELYQDCFILLGIGPYSAVDAIDLGLGDAEWNRLSSVIRLEHECAHYIMRRILGSIGHGLRSELIADYAGISAAVGRFRADWFLRFLGLENPERFRVGGRLEKYRGTPGLSDGAFSMLQALARRAAYTVEAADRAVAAAVNGMGADRRTRMILALATLTLEELAAETATDRLRKLL